MSTRAEILAILDFLKDAELLKSVTRHSWTTKGRQESVAEHTWRMALLALVLEKYFPQANIGRVIKMILIHDLGEVYHGDTPAFFKKADDTEREESDIKELFKLLPSDAQTELLNLWEEYKKNETLEAKLAKAIDKMETAIQHNEVDLSLWKKEDFEYDSRWEKRKKYTDFDEFMVEFREVVNEITKKKLKQSQ